MKSLEPTAVFVSIPTYDKSTAHSKNFSASFKPQSHAPIKAHRRPAPEPRRSHVIKKLPEVGLDRKIKNAFRHPLAKSMKGVKSKTNFEGLVSKERFS